ncbi:MAG: hypothetical protein DMG52_22715 [Acidobacteria bacterium]|nr:MAG: hypothetical protein DMG52_22715 [Acidobacteriota bacterium]
MVRGSFSIDWALVQPEVAKITRVCSYDRAGDEWSDAGPEWDTIKQVSTILMHGSKMVVNARPTF